MLHRSTDGVYVLAIYRFTAGLYELGILIEDLTTCLRRGRTMGAWESRSTNAATGGVIHCAEAQEIDSHE